MLVNVMHYQLVCANFYFGSVNLLTLMLPAVTINNLKKDFSVCQVSEIQMTGRFSLQDDLVHLRLLTTVCVVIIEFKDG